MRKYKTEFIATAIFLVLGVISICICRRHFDVRIFNQDEMYVSENWTDAVDGKGIISDKLQGNTGNGIVESPAMFLEKGSYVFSIGYETDSGNNTIQVVSDTTLDDEGNIGVIYAEELLDPEQKRITIQVQFEQDVTNLYIRIQAADRKLKIKEIAYRNCKKYIDSFAFWILYSLLAIYLYGAWNIQKRAGNRIFDISVFVISMGFIATLPFMNDFLIWGHDLDFHLARIEGMAKGLRYGQFPIRINPVQNAGYGYASPVMYPSLFLYFPAFLRLCGISLMNCYKVMIFAVNLMTAVCSYLCFKKVWGDRYAGVAGCALYMMGTYRIVNLYVRANLGESLAMAFLPLIFWGIYEVLFRDYKKWPVVVIGFSLVLQSHVLSTAICCLIVLAVFLAGFFFMDNRLKRIGAICLSGGLVGLCNLWFLFPMLDYMKEGFLALDSEIYIPDRTVYFSQVFMNFFEECFGPSLPLGSTKGEMPLSVGLSSLIGGIFFICMLIQYRDKIRKDKLLKEVRQIGLCSLGMAVSALALSSWILPWDILRSCEGLMKGLYTIQFMWRFLGPALFFFCCVSVSGVKIWLQINSEQKQLFVITFFLIAVILGWPILDAISNAATYPGREYAAGSNYTDRLYYYEKGDIGYGEVRGNIVSFNDAGKAVCKNMVKEGSGLTADILVDDGADETYIELPFYYYPGYRVLLNGEELQIGRGEKGVLRAYLPLLIPGKEYHLAAYFAEPVNWIAADIISVLTLFCCLLVMCLQKRKRDLWIGKSLICRK